MPKKAAIYARLSVAKDKSVSIEQQLESCRSYADARGWTVVIEQVDDGVSATHNQPQQRKGWQALLAAPDRYDAVIVMKVDRLARRTRDFLEAEEALRARGAGIVAVKDPVDMTTPQGRAFTTILTVFAELEAETIRSRVKDARDHLIQQGRVVGGTVPYGWRKVPSPEGKGFVLALDPERIDWVRGMAKRALDGETIYSIVRWLESANAPLPSASQKRRTHEGRWSYSTVERLLRNPILAGMRPYEPGRGRHEARDSTAVLRGSDGLPVVDNSLAILTPQQRRELVERLDQRRTPQSRPRASRNLTSPLLSGLATCDTCESTMHRGTTQGRPSLSCPSCHMVISRRQLDAHIADRLLSERGDLPLWKHEEIKPDNAAELADIEEAIRGVTASMAADDADVPALIERLDGLKSMRATARRGRPTISRWRTTSRTVREAWQACVTDEDRREVLRANLASLRITRGRVGRQLDPARVLIQWVAAPPGRPLPDGLRATAEVTTSLQDVDGVVAAIAVTLPDGTTMYTPKHGSLPRLDEHL